MENSTSTKNPLLNLLRLWFGLALPVNRRSYLLSGIILMAIKYAVDVSVIYWTTDGKWVGFYEYLSPFLASRDHLYTPQKEYVMWGLIVWTLPFMWIGISMSVRRAENAGISPWLALLFFVPFVNYLLMACLAIAPTSPNQSIRSKHSEVSTDARYISIMLKGAAIGVLLSLFMTAISVYVFGSYGASLFFGTPLVIGTVTAYIFNRPVIYSYTATAAVVSWSVFCAALALLLFALEGIVCIAMAFPVALIAALMGAVLGRYMADCVSARLGHACVAVLVLPFLSLGERFTPATPVDEVISAIEINASPEEVWPLVVGFSEIPTAPTLLFKSGIAYPIRARIEGSGVGAIRHCEFSTGAFVEPITAWEPPSRLAFDVTSQPAPLQEWSPYRHLHPPHLDGYFRSRRGEFRLKRTADNRTILEGSTWYELDLYPYGYWRVWTRVLIHQIHSRVLVHIKTLAESGSPSTK